MTDTTTTTTATFGSVTLTMSDAGITMSAPVGFVADYKAALRSAYLYEQAGGPLNALACALYQQYSAWHGYQTLPGRGLGGDARA